MLQFITDPANEHYSLAEQAQMAIEGGAAWVQLHLPDGADSAYLREVVTELKPLCQETSTILLLENEPEIAREQGLHGVHLTAADANAGAVREQLGPEAIIGMQVRTPEAARLMQNLDIDYVTLDPQLSPEQAAEVIAQIRAEGTEIPVVLTGDFDATDVDAVLATGASGIATGRKLMQADDPVTATEQLFAKLSHE